MVLLIPTKGLVFCFDLLSLAQLSKSQCCRFLHVLRLVIISHVVARNKSRIQTLTLNPPVFNLTAVSDRTHSAGSLAAYSSIHCQVAKPDDIVSSNPSSVNRGNHRLSTRLTCPFRKNKSVQELRSETGL